MYFAKGIIGGDRIMSFLRKRRLIGFLAFCIGLGILFAVMVPTIGWVMFSAICLICIGVFLLRF
jgi:hypothetical protein